MHHDTPFDLEEELWIMVQFDKENNSWIVLIYNRKNESKYIHLIFIAMFTIFFIDTELSDWKNLFSLT